jgi:Pyruvate/2-oxoacid:ferredoxin oxidoreductase delta subunit
MDPFQSGIQMKPFISQSTRAFYTEARRENSFSLFNFLHGYFYARWIYFYIAMGSGQHPLAKRMAPLLGWIGTWITRNAPTDRSTPVIKMGDTYHGKVVPLQSARELVSIKESIDLGDLEQIIPYALARDIVLQNPDHIVVMDCPCRVAKVQHCLPVDVCLVVGEPFAGFVLEHHPDRARSITSEEAQTILKEEDERGHVHHAFFKDAMLGRFYAICNCCSCCCAAIAAQRNGRPMLASSGYIAEIDQDICKDCGLCQKTCPFSAISNQEGMLVDREVCMGCGICTGQCRFDAIHLVRAESRGIPLEIQTLIQSIQG